MNFNNVFLSLYWYNNYYIVFQWIIIRKKEFWKKKTYYILLFVFKITNIIYARQHYLLRLFTIYDIKVWIIFKMLVSIVISIKLNRYEHNNHCTYCLNIVNIKWSLNLNKYIIQQTTLIFFKNYFSISKSKIIL